jgi:hypothetical protein
MDFEEITQCTHSSFRTLQLCLLPCYLGPCCLDKQVKNVNVLVSDIRLKKGETFFLIFGCHEKSFVLYRRRVEYGVCVEKEQIYRCNKLPTGSFSCTINLYQQRFWVRNVFNEMYLTLHKYKGSIESRLKDRGNSRNLLFFYGFNIYVESIDHRWSEKSKGSFAIKYSD